MKGILVAILASGFCCLASGQTGSAQEYSSVTLMPAMDTYISSLPQDLHLSFGNKPDLLVAGWQQKPTKYAVRSLLTFDLSEIPVGSIVLSAKLVLNGNGHEQYIGSNAASLFRVLSAWDEDTTSWLGHPAVCVDSIKIEASGSPDQSYSIDVTSIVQDWINQVNPNYGFLLKLQREENIMSALQFFSKDYEEPYLRPNLTIQYKSITQTPFSVSVRSGHCTSISSLAIEKGTPLDANERVSSLLWTYKDEVFSHYGLIRFNLDSIPKRAKVEKAVLILHGLEHSYEVDNSSYLLRLESSWDKDTTTWHGRPTKTFSHWKDSIILERSLTPDQTYCIPVTGIVQGWVSGDNNNNGWVLMPADSQLHRAMTFATFSHPDEALRPELILEYSILPLSYARLTPAASSSISKVLDDSLLFLLNIDEMPAPGATLEYVILSASLDTIGGCSANGLTQSSGSPIIPVNNGLNHIALDLASLPLIPDQIYTLCVKLPNSRKEYRRFMIP